MLTFPKLKPTAPSAPPVVLTLHGELDVVTSGPLRDTLRAAFEDGVRAVTVDLTDVCFMDASTLGVLVGAHRRFEAGGGTLRLLAPQRTVRRLFEVTGLDRVLHVEAR